jgi:hypothetical protein
VQFNVYQKSAIIVLAAYLPFITTAAFAQGEGATATTEVVQPVKVGLDAYVGAKELSPTELVDLLHLVGFEGKALKLAWAITMRESTGRPLSHNDSIHSGDNSFGLFQINMIGSLGADRREKFGIKSNSELFDPVTNAKAAFYMSARGTNWGSWGLGPDAYDGTASEPAVTKWLDKFPK